MARWAVGDIQGCCDELEELLLTLQFSVDRDQLWVVGDLVNRGPRSLAVLRLMRNLGDNVVCVLGNHDLHLLAVALTGAKLRKSDTLDEILAAADRDLLIEWLRYRPLAHYDAQRDDLLLHAGVVPQWSVTRTLEIAREIETQLRTAPTRLLEDMYGDKPHRWREDLEGMDRVRFGINVLTRLRFCTADGRVDLKHKGKPDSAEPPLMPWFKFARATDTARIIFGHWSALGFYRAPRLLALDTGCVWGERLTAVNLDDPEAPLVSVPSRQPRSIEE